jgi:hypothetical protein
VDCLKTKVDILTAPLETLQYLPSLDLNQKFSDQNLEKILYQEVDFSKRMVKNLYRSRINSKRLDKICN